MKKLTRILLLMALALTMSAGLNGCGPFVIGDEDNPVEPAPQPDPDEPVVYDPVELLQEAQEEGSLISFTYTVDGVERVATFKRVGDQYILQTPAATRGTENEDEFEESLIEYDFEDGDDDDDDDDGEDEFINEDGDGDDEDNDNEENLEEDNDNSKIQLEWDPDEEGEIEDEDDDDGEEWNQDYVDLEDEEGAGNEGPNLNARSKRRNVMTSNLHDLVFTATNIKTQNAGIQYHIPRGGGFAMVCENAQFVGGHIVYGSSVISVNEKGCDLGMNRTRASGKKFVITKLKMKKKKLSLKSGNTYILQAQVLPKNASKKSVTWTSSSKSYVSVSKFTKKTNKKEGYYKCTLTVPKNITQEKTVTITCKVKKAKKEKKKKKEKEGVSYDVCKVTAKPVQTTGVKLDKKSITVTYGSKSVQLKAKATPPAAPQKFSWTSNNNTVATVSNDGLVKFGSPGKATITAKHTSGKTATCTVTVNKKKGTISFGDPTTVKRFMTDGKTFTKEVGKTGDGEVKYSSSDTNVATVNETTGEVTIKGAGSTIITATVTDGKIYTYKKAKVTYTLNVSKQEGTIKFNDNVMSAVYGGTAPTNSLTNTGDGKVTYSVSPAGVATVDATTGAVTILGAGETTITASVTDGTNYAYATKTATYTLKVEAKDATISFGLDPNQVPVEKLNTDDRFTIAIQTNTGDGKVKYSSLNINVATVNETTGEVTITGVGETTITATVTEAQNYKYATPSVSYKLKVTAAPSNLGKPNNYGKGGNPFK